MPGMFTSSRITAKSWRRIAFSASLPEPALMSFWPRSDRTASSARSLSGRSSTSRMLTLSSTSSPAAAVT